MLFPQVANVAAPVLRRDNRRIDEALALVDCLFLRAIYSPSV